MIKILSTSVRLKLGGSARDMRNGKKICNKTQYLDKNEFKYTNSKNINVENDDENLYILFNENMK